VNLKDFRLENYWHLNLSALSFSLQNDDAFIFLLAQLGKVLTIGPSLIMMLMMLLLMQMVCVIWKWGTAMALFKVRLFLRLWGPGFVSFLSIL